MQNNVTKDYMFPLDAKIIGDKEITFADDDIYIGEVLSNNSARFISVQNPLATPNSYFIIDNVGAGNYIEEYNNKIREISCEDYGFTTNTLSNTDINKWMKSMYLTDKEEKISSVGGEYLEEAKTKSWFKRLFSSDDGKDIIKPFRISTDRDVDSDEMQVNSLFFHPLYYLQDEAPAGFFEGDDNYTASEKVALARAYLIAMSISCKLRPKFQVLIPVASLYE